MWWAAAAAGATLVAVGLALLRERLSQRADEKRLDRFFDRVVVKLATAPRGGRSSIRLRPLSSSSAAARTLAEEIDAAVAKYMMIGFRSADEQWKSSMLHKQLSAALQADLSLEEAHAVYLYTQDGFYERLNQAWRSQEQAQINEWRILSLRIMEAAYKIGKFGGDLGRVTLTRYTTLTSEDKEVFVAALKSKQEVTLCSFVSVSVRADIINESLGIEDSTLIVGGGSSGRSSSNNNGDGGGEIASGRARNRRGCNACIVFRSSSSVMPAGACISTLSTVRAEREYVIPPLTKMTVESVTEEPLSARGGNGGGGGSGGSDDGDGETLTVINVRVHSMFFLLELQAALQ